MADTGESRAVPALTLPSCMARHRNWRALIYLTGRIAPTMGLRRHIRRVSNALVPGGLQGASTPMTYRTWRAARFPDTCFDSYLSLRPPHSAPPAPYSPRSASPELRADDSLGDLVAHAGADVHREAVVKPGEDP